jgi:hypothetical protein
LSWKSSWSSAAGGGGGNSTHAPRNLLGTGTAPSSFRSTAGAGAFSGTLSGGRNSPQRRTSWGEPTLPPELENELQELAAAADDDDDDDSADAHRAAQVCYKLLTFANSFCRHCDCAAVIGASIKSFAISIGGTTAYALKW